MSHLNPENVSTAVIRFEGMVAASYGPGFVIASGEGVAVGSAGGGDSGEPSAGGGGGEEESSMSGISRVVPGAGRGGGASQLTFDVDAPIVVCLYLLMM